MISNFNLFLFYFIIFTNPIINPRSHESEAIRTEATEAKRTEAATRIDPKTSATLPTIRCALSTELSRSRGQQLQNGVYKPTLVARLSRNFKFRKRKSRSRNLSHCLYFYSTSGMGNFFSQRAICKKTQSFPGRIIRWIEFNIFINYSTHSSDVLCFHRKYR